MNLRATLQEFEAKMGSAESSPSCDQAIPLLPEVRNEVAPMFSASEHHLQKGSRGVR